MSDPHAAPPPGTGRREAIADAAIALIAEQGLRALTHRAVDRRLDLADGSTSYYARNRRQLLELVVHRLAGRTRRELAETAAGPPGNVPPPPAGTTSVDETTDRLVTLLERVAGRSRDQRARFALAVDLVPDPELHALVTHDSPVRRQALQQAATTLRHLGVADPDTAARGLVAVVDGLLFDRLAGSGTEPAHRSDAAAVLRAYLNGLPREDVRTGVPRTPPRATGAAGQRRRTARR